MEGQDVCQVYDIGTTIRIFNGHGYVCTRSTFANTFVPYADSSYSCESETPEIEEKTKEKEKEKDKEQTQNGVLTEEHDDNDGYTAEDEAAEGCLWVYVNGTRMPALEPGTDEE